MPCGPAKCSTQAFAPRSGDSLGAATERSNCPRVVATRRRRIRLGAFGLQALINRATRKVRRDPKASLRELVLYFVTDNARPVVMSIEATAKNAKPAAKSTGITPSGGEAPKPATGIKLSWKVDNPDQDDLRYRVSYRIDGQTTWRSANKPTDKITKTELEWDTTGLPEGTYRIRVEASDEMANPPERVQRHVLESGAVLVDNTPPVYKSLSMQSRKLKGEISDGLGPISRVEVAVAGTDEWRPIFPTDGIFDEATETFDVDVSSIVPAGTQLVVVRAYDTAGNVVTRDVDAR
jgi:hypothetical protein